jgi:hypothetical protein
VRRGGKRAAQHKVRLESRSGATAARERPCWHLREGTRGRPEANAFWVHTFEEAAADFSGVWAPRRSWETEPENRGSGMRMWGPGGLQRFIVRLRPGHSRVQKLEVATGSTALWDGYAPWETARGWPQFPQIQPVGKQENLPEPEATTKEDFPVSPFRTHDMCTDQGTDIRNGLCSRLKPLGAPQPCCFFQRVSVSPPSFPQNT